MKTENYTNRDLCGEAEFLIDDYLEGMITLSDKDVINKHVSRCSKCRDYLKETSELVKQINFLSEMEINLSSDKKNKLWQNIENGISMDSGQSNPKGQPSLFKYIISGLAACIVITAGIFAFKSINFSKIEVSRTNVIGLPTYWKVSNLQGTPMIGEVAMNSIDSIVEGQWIKTGESSRAQLIIANIGSVIIEPNSMIRFIRGADGDSRIAIEYGTIDTKTHGTGKAFFVEMPSAIATDYGVAYSLTVDSTGDGLVYVESGKVEVRSSNRDAIVPAGNVVMTRKNSGVGTPFNENSSLQFKTALLSLDYGECEDLCVNTILKNAKKTDAISLLNIISKVDDRYKDKVYAKLANFVPPPPNVPSDSGPSINQDKINKWVEKIQSEVQKNIEHSMNNIQQSLENIKEIENLNFEMEGWSKDWSKNWKFEYDEDHAGEMKNFEWNADSINFDREQLKKDLEEMKKDLKENLDFNNEEFKKDMEEMKKDLKENLDFDNEEFKKDMEEMKNDLKEMNKDLEKMNLDFKQDFNFNSEEFKKEMEKVKEEMHNSMEEMKKNKKIPKIDSLHKNRNNDFENEDREIPDTPEEPK